MHKCKLAYLECKRCIGVSFHEVAMALNSWESFSY